MHQKSTISEKEYKLFSLFDRQNYNSRNVETIKVFSKSTI